MSRRNLLRAYQVFTNANTATAPTGTETDVSGLDNITYQITVQNTVNCEMAVYVSKDDARDGTYSPLYFGEQIILDGSVETDYFIQIKNPGFKWMVLEFENTLGGSGTLNAWVSGNSEGA